MCAQRFNIIDGKRGARKKAEEERTDAKNCKEKQKQRLQLKALFDYQENVNESHEVKEICRSSYMGSITLIDK